MTNKSGKQNSQSGDTRPDASSLPASQLVLYQTQDGRRRIEVRLQDETVWLNKKLMADLFQTGKQNISLHLKNIFEDEELDEERVVRET